jgi:hypothetical protein
MPQRLDVGMPGEPDDYADFIVWVCSLQGGFERRSSMTGIRPAGQAAKD